MRTSRSRSERVSIASRNDRRLLAVEERAVGIVRARGGADRLADLAGLLVARGALSETTLARSSSPVRSRSSGTPIFSSAASSCSFGVPAVLDEELLLRPVDRTGERAGGAGHAILAAELVDDRAGDARPGVLLERGALDGIEPVDRLDDGDEAARDQVVELAVGRELARLARREVLDHRRVGENEPVARAGIAALTPGPPERSRPRGR